MFKTVTLVLLLATLVYSNVATTTTANPCRYTLNYGAFAKDPAFLAATSQGFFAEFGVCVNYYQVTGSVQQFASLASGAYDVISTASDNIVNRVVNNNLPLSMIAAVEKGAGFVVAGNSNNGINKLSDLKGKALAVDAPDSGFVLGLRLMLQQGANLTYPADYSFQIVGGTYQRYNALEAGTFFNPATNQTERVYGSIMTTPFTQELHNGVIVLARLSDYIAPFQDSVLAVNSTVANRPALVAFLKAYLRGVRYVYAGVVDCNNDGVIDNPTIYNSMISQIAGSYFVNNATAAVIYASFTDCVTGLNPDLIMNNLGLVNMIKLRQQYGGFNTNVNPVALAQFQVGGFNDPSYYAEAFDQVGFAFCGRY